MTQSEFEHIALQLRGRMLKVALDFFGNQDDAEDVTQEAMVQASTTYRSSVGRCEAPSSFSYRVYTCYLLFIVGLGRKKEPPQKILEAPQWKKEAPQRGKNNFPSIPSIPTINYAPSNGLKDQKYA